MTHYRHYYFVIGMESLSKILNKEVKGQYLGGFIVNGTINDPLDVSHL